VQTLLNLRANAVYAVDWFIDSKPCVGVGCHSTAVSVLIECSISFALLTD